MLANGVWLNEMLDDRNKGRKRRRQDKILTVSSEESSVSINGV